MKHAGIEDFPSGRLPMTRAAVLLVGLCLVFAPARAAEDITPTDVVRQLYAEPRPDRSDLYTERLQGLFDARARQANGGGLTFDYRLNHEPVGHDVAKDLSFVETRSGPRRAEVDVSLVDDRPQRIVYVLVREGSLWRVDDARSLGEPSWELSDILAGPPR